MTHLAEFWDELLNLINEEANKGIFSPRLEYRPAWFVAGLSWGQTPPALTEGHKGFGGWSESSPPPCSGG